jgi:DNA invertase Pin-like site-specific DNA recombinase
MESGVEFVAVDTPAANKLTVHILAAVAEDEAKRISDRTKAALQAAKARGTVLGGRRVSRERFAEISAVARNASAVVRTAKAAKLSSEVLPVIHEIRAAGAKTLRQIAAELNARGETTPRGASWTSVQVFRLLSKSYT